MTALNYLAAPYTSPNEFVIMERMNAMMKIDAQLFTQGIFCVSPLYKHFMTRIASVDASWETWKQYSESLIEACEQTGGSLYVLMLDGWEQSPGVQAEIACASDFWMQIVYLLPDGTIDSITSKEDHYNESLTRAAIAAGR